MSTFQFDGVIYLSHMVSHLITSRSFREHLNNESDFGSQTSRTNVRELQLITSNLK